MPKFSKISKERLSTCDSRLQEIMNELIELYDFSVLCGHRGKEAQEEAVAKGTSSLHWPNSKHNTVPSLAIDIAPYPIDWENIERFKYLGSLVFKIAVRKGITLRWGASWGDYPHFEIRR